jgi:hypothetical protein
MVSSFVLALLIRGASSSRVASEHSGHVDIQHHSEKVRASQVTCQQTWNDHQVPDGCPLPEFDYTNQVEIPLESCPESCQTYFTAVVDSCAVGTELVPPPSGWSARYGETFAQYTLWEQFHSRYPTCNLGAAPPACQRAWNDERMPSGCPIAGFANGSTVPVEFCPEPCQTYFTGVLDSCSVGERLSDIDDHGTGSSTYAQHNLWGTFNQVYPACNLGYTASACDIAMNAVLNTAYTVCEKPANSPCTAECAALFEAVRTGCSSSATYVPTSGEGSRTFSEQTWSLNRVTALHFDYVYDETCVALLSAF